MLPPPIRHYRGDTWLRSWIIKDSTGVPFQINAARLHVRPQEGVATEDELVLSARIGDKITTDPGTGRVDLRVEAADMGIAPGVYRFELEITDSVGVVRTIEQGRLLIIEDVAHD